MSKTKTLAQLCAHAKKKGYHPLPHTPSDASQYFVEVSSQTDRTNEWTYEWVETMVKVRIARSGQSRLGHGPAAVLRITDEGYPFEIRGTTSLGRDATPDDYRELARLQDEFFTWLDANHELVKAQHIAAVRSIEDKTAMERHGIAV